MESAPSDPSKRYDDEDYHVNELSDSFELRRDFPYHDRQPQNVGYPMHQRCWQLLCQWARVQGVGDVAAQSQVKFLYELHQSPLDGTGSDWAGDYDGLLGMINISLLSVVHA